MNRARRSQSRKPSTSDGDRAVTVNTEAASADIPLDAAQAIVAGCLEEAAKLNVLVSVAVVDSGGHLKAFARMDGAEIAGPTLAIDKAYTAVAHRSPTHELAKQAAPGGPLFGLHANGAGRYVIFGGGIPIRAGGRILGAVGVSGATVDEDTRCAQAGAELAERQLAHKR